MIAIYEPRGKAREYAPLACNLYRGCTHGCRYCYVPACLHMSPAEFHTRAEPRPGILEALERDAARLAGDPRPVLLCFTCDPYQPEEMNRGITIAALEIFEENGMRANVLTKNTERALYDLDLFERNPSWQIGTTAVFADPAKCTYWEPGAPPTADRLSALSIFAAHGVETWVSLEPVIEPDETLALLDSLPGVARIVKVGRWNHAREANAIDWPGFLDQLIPRLRALGLSWYIKDDLYRLRQTEFPQAYGLNPAGGAS